jgi:hypothetical protein
MMLSKTRLGWLRLNNMSPQYNNGSVKLKIHDIIETFLSKCRNSFRRVKQKIEDPEHRVSLLWISFLSLSLFFFFVSELVVVAPSIEMSVGITQILATVFTFVASMSLLAAQLSTRYTGKALDIVFNRRTITYLFFLALTVFFSVIQSERKELVGLMVVFLLMLTPYFYDLKEMLKPDTLIKEMGKRANAELRRLLNRVDDKSQTSIEHEIENVDLIAGSLHDAMMNAYSRYEYDEFELALDQLINLVETAYLESKQSISKLLTISPANPPIFRRIRTVGEDVMKNDYASRIFLEKILKIGREIIDAGEYETIELVLAQLGLIVSYCVTLGEKNRLEQIRDILARLTRHATRSNQLRIASRIKKAFDDIRPV